MLRTLRNRLILSHILPSLVIVPLMGVVLIYVLETQVVIPSLTSELAGQAVLIAEILGKEAGVFEDPEAAHALVTQTRHNLEARVMLLDFDGRILVSTDAADAARLGEQLEIPGLENAQLGQVVEQVNYSQSLHSEVIDVLAPVYRPTGSIIGFVRMSYRFATVAEQVIRLRAIIGWVTLAGLLLGVAVAMTLAININAPLQRVTRAVYDLALGRRREELTVRGPEELAQLLRAVNFLVERLEDLERARRNLLANLVHELGRPLGAMRAAIQALSRGAKEDPSLTNELLSGMHNEADLLERVLDDLSHLYDQVLGIMEIDLQAVDMQEWLPAILRSWKALAEEKNLQWEANVASGLPTILADPVRLGQVVGNLLSNAIKYTSTPGTVSVSASAGDGWVFIRISDTGLGIADEDQQKIFTPFFRGEQGSRIKQGMGLGLSIAQDIVKAHGGYIELKSVLGVGSQFTIHLPENPYPELSRD